MCEFNIVEFNKKLRGRKARLTYTTDTEEGAVTEVVVSYDATEICFYRYINIQWVATDGNGNDTFYYTSHTHTEIERFLNEGITHGRFIGGDRSGAHDDNLVVTLDRETPADEKYRKIIITRGLPASGKTTWAMAYVKEKPMERIRVCKDDIRNMFGEYWVPEREQAVEHVAYACLSDLMIYSTYNEIVIDGTNFNKRWIGLIEHCVNLANFVAGDGKLFKIEYKDFFDVPLEECIRRDAQRGIHQRGEKIIREFYEKYKSIIEKK